MGTMRLLINLSRRWQREVRYGLAGRRTAAVDGLDRLPGNPDGVAPRPRAAAALRAVALIALCGFGVGLQPAAAESCFELESAYSQWSRKTRAATFRLPKADKSAAESTFAHLRKFRAETLASGVDVNPFSLILRQLKLMQSKFPGFRSPFDLSVAEGQTGNVREINCLERALLNFHFSQFGPETEFSAYILEKEGQRLVHVQTMVQSFVADDDFFADKVEPDIAAGFRLIAHLHNHPFFFQNKSGDVAGTLVASGPDCRFFLSLMADHPGMKAIITNGFHSNEFSLEEVQRCDREKNRPAKGPWSKA